MYIRKLHEQSQKSHKHITKSKKINLFLHYSICFLLCSALIPTLCFSKNLSSKNKHKAVNKTHHNLHAYKPNNVNNRKPAQTNNIYIDANISRSIAKIISKYDGSVNIGVQIQSASNGNIIYQQNAKRLFTPSSSLKIFTAAGALAHLGSDYKFKTQVITKNGSMQNGTFNGDIYFYFDGDPLLTRQDLNNLVETLKKSGINKINGNIYIDDSIFDQSNYGPGWMWDEENFCYAAPTNATIIDKNCFPFKIIAAQKTDQPAKITVDQNHEFIKIVNSVTTKKLNYEDYPFNIRAGEDNTYYLTGFVWPHAKDINLSTAVKNIRIYAKHILLDLLTQNQIVFNEKINFAKSAITENQSFVAGKDYVVLAEHASKPLNELIRTMLKKSDNQIADALFKKLGYSYFHKTATWRNSSKALIEILSKRFGMNFINCKIVDGSGLSRYNLVTPEKMTQLLYYVYHDNNIRSDFFNSLSISGTDGTLKYRMSASDLIGKIHAKTGTMTGNISLTGYITTANKKILFFTIIINNFLGGYHKYRLIEDDICALLTKISI